MGLLRGTIFTTSNTLVSGHSDKPWYLAWKLTLSLKGLVLAKSDSFPNPTAYTCAYSRSLISSSDFTTSRRATCPVSHSSQVLGPKLTLTDPFEVSEPPADVISSLRFSSHPDSYKFVVASWDKFAYLYEIKDDKQCALIKKFEHQAPVLDACFGKDDDELYTTCLDWNVRR